LKEQPDGVLLKEEMESKRHDLMDFIVDMEQYSLQMSQQLKELDDSFAELKGVCQEEAELLEKGEETVRKLRKAYEDVAAKVGQYA
jgi:archaellum component FlaC